MAFGLNPQGTALGKANAWKEGVKTVTPPGVRERKYIYRGLNNPWRRKTPRQRRGNVSFFFTYSPELHR